MKARGCRWTFRPMGRRSCSSCWATSTRCRSRVGKRNRSRAEWRSTASRDFLLMGSGSRLFRIARAARTSGSFIRMAPSRSKCRRIRTACSRLAGWAPDGKYVFVSKAGFGITSYEIWMYHVDGGTGVQITKAKPTPATPRKERPNAMGVVASPDGKYLYYAMRKGPFSYNAHVSAVDDRAARSQDRR